MAYGGSSVDDFEWAPIKLKNVSTHQSRSACGCDSCSKEQAATDQSVARCSPGSLVTADTRHFFGVLTQVSPIPINPQ
jgi:hypothetical protein